MKVWILSITHKHGTDLTAYRKEASARQALWAFVESWWDDEMGKDTPFPDDNAEAIAAYFEKVEDESYVIDHTDILD